MEFNKTEEQLKQMTEDELFAYLDAKAKHLSKHTSPLSYHKSLRYASLSSSISNSQFDYDGAIKKAEEGKELAIKKIINKNKKD